MTEPTIGVALIVGKNRLDQLKRLLPQLMDFDQVVLLNTSGQGSVKNLAKRFKNVEYHDYVWRGSVYKHLDSDGKPIRTVLHPVGAAGELDPLDTPPYYEMYDLNDWGFSGARNESFKYLKTTHALWLDTDDLIGVKYNGQDVPLPARAAADTFRKIAREAPDVDVWFADYIYSRDEYGNPNVVHARERLVRLECGWKWVYPIHECLVPGRSPKHSIIRDIEILHYPNVEQVGEASSERNLKILNQWYTQLQKNEIQHDMSRCRLQIGETYWGMERYREAAEWLEFEYLANHQNSIDLEQFQGACFAAKSYIQCGNLAGAERMALKALTLEPGLMDGYYLLAEIKLVGEQDPQDVLELLDAGSRKDEPPPEAIKNPQDYTFSVFMLTSEAKFQVGDYSAALDFALKALKVCPNDPRPERLRAQAAQKLREQEGTQAALALYQLLADFDEHEKASQIFEMLPYPVQRRDEIHRVAESAVDRISHVYNMNKYEEFYSNPPGWEPVPWNFFEENKVPGRDRYEYLLSRLRKYPYVKRVLWLGCEDGFHALLLAQAGYEVVGIDLNPEAIRIANERAEKLGVSAKFKEGWIEKIRLDTFVDPFDDEPFQFHFDAIVATEQIEKCRDVSFFLATLGDCLKDDGVMLLTTPDGSWDGGDHPHNSAVGKPKAIRTFRQDTLEAILRNGGEEFWLTECHFLPYSQAYREGQGWQVAEVIRKGQPRGPRIRIFCGELTFEAFSPRSLAVGGVGGSETAVIQMADWWAKMGCQVVVYGKEIGIYDGVLYRYADEYSHDFESDIFIGWRLPQAFMRRPNAKVSVLWAHDTHYPLEIQPEWVNNIDVVAVLSEFHKGWILNAHPQIPEEKVWVTRNGIDPLRYAQKVERKKHHYFYSSSHNRGLEELLILWPDIKKAIPDAELHVGYGTYTAAQIMKQMRNREGLDDLRELEETMFEADGINYHGRMNQWELARVQLGCEAWLYPYQHDAKWEGNGGFLETYCLTAVEAQAAGCIAISRLNGALPEVLKYNIEWTKEWTTEDLISTLQNLDSIIDKDKVEEARQWALKQTWQSLAGEWLKHFASLRKQEEITN